MRKQNEVELARLLQQAFSPKWHIDKNFKNSIHVSKIQAGEGSGTLNTILITDLTNTPTLNYPK
ncbi:MAG: hypothetical protein CMQ08_02195 [Gammaproteobacteria bacterium]|nr:hypothetical protein [Gammaproteobacteria bacterium]